MFKILFPKVAKYDIISNIFYTFWGIILDKIGTKDQVVSDIVQKLESDGGFTEIVTSILQSIGNYLNTSDAQILQISADESNISTIINYASKKEKSVKVISSYVKDFSLCSNQLLYLTYDNSSDNQRQLMDQLHIRTSVTMPIYINDILAMYFAVFDQEESIAFSQEKLQFIHDVSIIIQSIAQKKVTKNSLLSSYEVLREILNSIGSGILVCNKNNGTILFENEIAQSTEEIERTIKDCLEDYFSHEKANQQNNPQSDGTIRRDVRPVEHYDAKSGLWFELKFADLTWIDGSKVIVCTAMDITQKKKNQQRIEYQAHNDFLTGLYNRMKCENDLKKLLRSAIKSGETGAIMFIDLDNFKHINDGLGHQYGDVLLQQVATGLQGIPGLRDHCYRMGGDEFVIIVVPELYHKLDTIINNITLMFNKPWYLMETEYYCTMSMGIAKFPDDSKDVNEVIKLADIAMYDSKKSGKNQYSFYDNARKQNIIQRLDIETNMRQAIATEIQEFIVFYQPVMDVNTMTCSSCEALVRWDSKTLGFLGPGDFIPLAEYLGLITSIGDYVFEESCKQCKIWNDNGFPDFKININLSVVQLLQKNVVQNIDRILRETKVNPVNVVLEITESFAINDMDRVLNIISEIKKLGPQIALDDFGTGYSSLNYIKQLPLDIIKVDKAFIKDILEDEYAQAFVKLIVDLSKTIDTKIVVEGIENKEQFNLLKELGVNYIQGYLFGKPVPAEEFEQLIFKKQITKNKTKGEPAYENIN
jgi:diguanylate cyclase (GGDEF)-like protein